MFMRRCPDWRSPRQPALIRPRSAPGLSATRSSPSAPAWRLTFTGQVVRVYSGARLKERALLGPLFSIKNDSYSDGLQSCYHLTDCNRLPAVCSGVAENAGAALFQLSAVGRAETPKGGTQL